MKLKHIMQKILLLCTLLALVFTSGGCGCLLNIGRDGEVQIEKSDGRYDEIDKQRNEENLSKHLGEKKEEKAPAAKPISQEQGIRMSIERPEGQPVEIFRVGNDLAVLNGGASPSVTLKQKFYLTEITTYHWNGGGGTAPGTISLKSGDGKVYGPWNASLVNGVYWVAKPEQEIAAGAYAVIDSNPATWAQNSQSGGKGMTWASGVPMK